MGLKDIFNDRMKKNKTKREEWFEIKENLDEIDDFGM